MTRQHKCNSMHIHTYIYIYIYIYGYDPCSTFVSPILRGQLLPGEPCTWVEWSRVDVVSLLRWRRSPPEGARCDDEVSNVMFTRRYRPADCTVVWTPPNGDEAVVVMDAAVAGWQLVEWKSTVGRWKQIDLRDSCRIYPSTWRCMDDVGVTLSDGRTTSECFTGPRTARSREC